MMQPLYLLRKRHFAASQKGYIRVLSYSLNSVKGGYLGGGGSIGLINSDTRSLDYSPY